MSDKNKDLLNNWNDQLSGLYQEAAESSFPLTADLKKNAERYSEKTLVGEGGEKKVFSVFDRLTGRTVALAEPVSDSEKDIERFVREARIISSLEHPNIIPVYDLGLEGEKPYFTMELATGRSLKDLINDELLDELLDIFVKVCDAIGFAHSKGVLNLDLKPDNIHVGSFSKVLVLDWGIAENKSAADSEPGIVKGTPGFMAPEQFTCSSRLSEKTDIFQLGAILYCILTKQPPFTGSSLEEIKANTLNGSLKPMESGSSNSLVSICEKALSHSPEDRYKSVAELKNEVVKFQRGFATSAEKAGFSKQLMLFYRRNFLVCNVILAALLLTVSLTTIFILKIQSSEEKAQKARMKAEELLTLYENQKNLSVKMEEGINKALDTVLSKGKMTEEIEKLLLKSTYSLSGVDNYDAAQVFVMRLIRNNPENDEAWRHLGFLYFVKNDFKNASICFKRGPDSEICREMIRLSEKYLNLYKNKELNNDEILNVLCENIDHEKWSWTQTHLLNYYRLKSRDKNGFIKLVEAVLQNENGSAKIEIKLEGDKLIFTESSGLKTLMFKYPPHLIINIPEVKEIDFNSSEKVRGISELKKMGVKVN